MSFLNVDTSNAVEPTIATVGEYKVRIIGYITDAITGEAVRNNKVGNPYTMPIFEICDDPTAKEITKYIPLPYDGQPEKEKNKDMLNIQAFEKCFQIEEVAPGDHEATIGKEGFVMLGLGTNSQSGEEENFIKKFM